MKQIRKKLEGNDKFSRLRLWKLFYQGLTFGLIVATSSSFASHKVTSQESGKGNPQLIIMDSSANTAIASYGSNTSVLANDNTSLNPFSVSQSVTYSPDINFGGYVSSDNPKASGQVGLLVPIWQNTTQLFFLDSSLYDASQSPFEGNFSLGYRFMPNRFKKQMLLGAFLGYDRVRSEAANYFNQFSLGTEFWRNRLFLGSHFYIPFGGRTKADFINNTAYTTQANSAGYSHLVYQQGREVILPGFELQAGYNIWHGLTVFAGPYYYKSSGFPTVWGPKIRALYQWDAKPGRRILGVMNRIGVETQFEHDKPRGSNWYVGIRASIDIGFHGNQKFTGVQRHMIDSLRHEYNAITFRYLTAPQPYQINGRVANVFSVSNLTQLNDAVNDPNVDIIAVNGTVDGVDNLVLGSNRSIVITGGDFAFTVDGESYTARNVGHNGELQQVQGAIDALINIQNPEGNDVSLENLNLSVGKDSNNSDNYAIYDRGSGGGTLTIHGVTSNGAVVVQVTEANQSVNVVFDNNYVNTDAESVPAGPVSTVAAVDFLATGGGTINVTSFTNNQITNNILASSTINPNDAYAGLNNYAGGGGATINYTGLMTNNTIIVASEVPQVQGKFYAMINDAAFGDTTAVNFNGEVANNNFSLIVTGPFPLNTSSFGAAVLSVATNKASVNFFGGFNNNILDISNAFVAGATSSVAVAGLQTTAGQGANGGSVNYSQITGNTVLGSSSYPTVGFLFQNFNASSDEGGITVGGVTNPTDFSAQNNGATVIGGDAVNNWN